MVDPDADPAFIRGKIIDAIRHRTAQLLDQKIMDPNLFGIAPRAPLPSAILKVANQFLLLRIDRDHGLLTGQHSCHALIDVGELCVAIRMAVSLARLAVALQAELLLFEHFTNDSVTDPMAKGAQFGGQTPEALAGPAQRRHGVAPLARRHQRQQIVQKFWIAHQQRFATAARTANPVALQAGRRQLL